MFFIYSNFIKKTKSWLKSVSAFANGLGGTLFFGVDDNGKVIGVDNPQFISEKISEIVNSKINPIPTIRIEPFNENNKVIVVLKVSPGPATPYYYAADGIREAYIRNGNQSIITPTHILDELILKGQNKSYDSIQTKLLKNDYSFSIFEADFLEKTHTRLTIEDYISFSLMDANGFLTNAGILLADQYIYRHNRIFCTRWNGMTKTSLEEASDDIELTGGLIELLKSTLKFIKNNTKKKWKKTTRQS